MFECGGMHALDERLLLRAVSLASMLGVRERQDGAERLCEDADHAVVQLRLQQSTTSTNSQTLQNICT
jgi:hypothetical protein